MTKPGRGKRTSHQKAVHDEWEDENKGPRQVKNLTRDLEKLAMEIFSGTLRKMPKLYGDAPHPVTVQSPILWAPVFAKRLVLVKRLESIIGKSRDAPLVQISEDATAKVYPQFARDYSARAFYNLDVEVRKKHTKQGSNPETQETVRSAPKTAKSTKPSKSEEKQQPTPDIKTEVDSEQTGSSSKAVKIKLEVDEAPNVLNLPEKRMTDADDNQQGPKKRSKSKSTSQEIRKPIEQTPSELKLTNEDNRNNTPQTPSDMKSIEEVPVQGAKSTEEASSHGMESIEEASPQGMKSMEEDSVQGTKSIEEAPPQGTESIEEAFPQGMKSMEEDSVQGTKSIEEAPLQGTKSIYREINILGEGSDQVAESIEEAEWSFGAISEEDDIIT